MKLKDLLITFIKKIVLSFILTIIICFFIDNNGNIDVTINGEKVSLKSLFVIYFFVTFVYILIEGLYYLLKNKTYKVKYDYYRQLPRDYSPSIVSFLMNLKLEYKKDILADLIFLEERKIIEIDSNQNIKIVSKNNIWKNYEKHLQFLITKIETINNFKLNKLLDAIDLDFKVQYKNYIINDLNELNLIEGYSSNKLLKKMIGIFLIFVAIICAFNFIFSDNIIIEKVMSVFIFLGIIFGMVLFLIYIVNKLLVIYNRIIGKNFMRSKKGKEDVSLWISYSNFIKNFSIMEERSLEEKELWGYYFAYGLALGINKKTIKKFGLEYEKFIIN